jgi:hypothetical protein
MTALAIGIGIPFLRPAGAGIDAQAQAHYNRVIADGGLIPSGLVGVNNFFKTVKGIYGTSDITTAISVGLDAQVLGYKLGAGAGTTAGQAAQKLYSCSGSSGDVVQTTAASQPLLLTFDGVNNYLFLPKVSGNYCSTPRSVANEFTGDINFCAKVSIVKGSFQNFCSKYGNAGNRSFLFTILASNVLSLFVGATNYNSTIAVPFANNDLVWVRVTRNSASGDINYFTSTDNVGSANLVTTWTQLGATVSSPSGALPSTIDKTLEIGTDSNGTSGPLEGKIYRCQLYASLNFSAPVVDFNPNQYNAATSQTQWTSSTGEVWTINTGTASTGYKGQIVTKTIVQGDGIDDVMGKNSAFTSTKNLSVYSAKKSFNITTSNGYISSAVNPGEMVLSDISFFIGGSTFSPTGRSTLLQFSALRQSSSNTSKVRYNANADTSGTPTTVACNRIILFGSPYAWDYGTAQYSNNILSTVIITSNYDSDATSTSIYNVIRSINENAF